MPWHVWSGRRTCRGLSPPPAHQQTGSSGRPPGHSVVRTPPGGEHQRKHPEAQGRLRLGHRNLPRPPSGAGPARRRGHRQGRQRGCDRVRLHHTAQRHRHQRGHLRDRGTRRVDHRRHHQRRRRPLLRHRAHPGPGRLDQRRRHRAPPRRPVRLPPGPADRRRRHPPRRRTPVGQQQPHHRRKHHHRRHHPAPRRQLSPPRPLTCTVGHTQRSRALPDLSGRALTLYYWVGVAGFEPTASSSRTKRAAKLRHTPVPRRLRRDE